MRTKALSALVLLAACGGGGAAVSPPSGRVSAASSGAAVTPAVLPAQPASSALAPASPSEAALVFVENDYPLALAQARAKGVPLFIDAWATWCHTCLSMKSYVFPDPRLRRFASRFVWLSVDTERDENEAIVGKLDAKVLPTLYVLDAATEKPVVAWPGSLTAKELADLLDDAASAVARGDGGGAAGAALLRGHQAGAAGKVEDAIAAYRAALAAAPADWPRRPEAVDALVTRLGEAKQAAACATTGADEAPRLPPGTALADVLRAALSCVDDLPPKAPERARLPELTALAERVAGDPGAPILADDRSDLYNYLLDALKSAGRTDDVARVAHSWSAFLDDQAAHAPDPAARAVFDAHRLLAYLALGRPELAVPMLQQSERDFPSDYNPPARLATAFLRMKRYDDSASAVGRALERAYGPRKLRRWSLQADVCEAKGDKAGARKALGDALAFAKTLPPGLGDRYGKLRESLEKRLARLK